MGGPTRLPAGRTRIAHACGGARLMRFRRVPLNDVDWAELDRFADRTHAQRLPWLNYLTRSEEHTSELPVTNAHLVCRLLLEKKKETNTTTMYNKQHLRTIKETHHVC